MATGKSREGKEKKEIIVLATYEKDSRRYKRFTLQGEGFVGTIYVPKESPVPSELKVVFGVNEE